MKVGQQQRFVLVDDDRRCGVKGLNVDDAEADARVGDQPFQPVGEVDELGRQLRGRDVDSGRDGRSKPA